MTTALARSTVQAFFQAFASKDPAQLAHFVHEDAVWSIVGPVELIRYCGEYRGKAAVLDVFGRIAPAAMRLTRFEPEVLLVDGDRCAILARLTGVMPENSRTISYRTTQFARFENGQVIEFQALIDSFDAAQQFLGHAIDLSRDALVPMRQRGGLVAV